LRRGQPASRTFDASANLVGLLVEAASHDPSAARCVTQHGFGKPRARIVRALTDSGRATGAGEIVNVLCQRLPAPLASTQNTAGKRLSTANQRARAESARNASCDLSSSAAAILASKARSRRAGRVGHGL